MKGLEQPAEPPHILVPQEAAKEALYRRNLVESEVSSWDGCSVLERGQGAVALNPL